MGKPQLSIKLHHITGHRPCKSIRLISILFDETWRRRAEKGDKSKENACRWYKERNQSKTCSETLYKSHDGQQHYEGHLKLRRHIDISQNEIEDCTEKDVSKVNCFRLHCNCTIHQDHFTYHLADTCFVADQIIQLYSANVDMNLISRAFDNASDEKIVYIYVRQITTTGIDKDQLNHSRKVFNVWHLFERAKKHLRESYKFKLKNDKINYLKSF